MTQPDYQYPAEAGDPAHWGLYYMSDCDNNFPGEIMHNSIVAAFKRSQIKYVESMLNTYYDANKALLSDATGVSSGSAVDCDNEIAHNRYSFEHYVERVQAFYNINDYSPPPIGDRFRILYMGEGCTENDKVQTTKQWTLGQSDAVDLGGGYIRGLAVVYVDDIHYIRCRENRTRDWVANAIVHTAVHELGHVATAHAADAHYNHNDPYMKCCYLLPECDMDSKCGYGIDYAGFCKRHTDEIASRRNNAEKY
ncbi:MAG TPA: hypothetical protein PK916_07620 [Bacteroidota bacterium]|nr:hypothetical protein [Bacteroidota bacterium]